MTLSVDHPALLALAVGVVAMLYASVGHAGASGYLAVMSLAGVAAPTMKPIALTLNVLVSAIGAYQFWRAGHFRWSLFWPFAAASIPAAALGGALILPPLLLKRLIGVVLLFSAARFFWKPAEPAEVRPPSTPLALAAGGGLGLLAGVTGTGGGIFLTPLMLLCQWATTKTTAATSALFIFVNSVSGLSGHMLSGGSIPRGTAALAAAAVVGGTIGSYLGSRKISPRSIRLLLAVVLVVAGLNLLLERKKTPEASPALAPPTSGERR